MVYKYFLFEKSEGIATITINRPEVLNALSNPTLLELKDILKLVTNDREVVVILLTGMGRSFSVGSDLKSRDLPTDTPAYHRILGQGVMNMIEILPKPVIAVINGFALGGGTELMLACDVRIASETAVFGLPEVNLGSVPGFGGTQRLSRQIGMSKAKELMFTGDYIEAEEALRIGLINKMVPKGKLMDTARELARKLAGKNPVALERIKFLANNAADVPVRLGVIYELLDFGPSGVLQQPEEGDLAFESMKNYRERFSGRK